MLRSSGCCLFFLLCLSQVSDAANRKGQQVVDSTKLYANTVGEAVEQRQEVNENFAAKVQERVAEAAEKVSPGRSSCCMVCRLFRGYLQASQTGGLRAAESAAGVTERMGVSFPRHLHSFLLETRSLNPV